MITSPSSSLNNRFGPSTIAETNTDTSQEPELVSPLEKRAREETSGSVQFEAPKKQAYFLSEDSTQRCEEGESWQQRTKEPGMADNPLEFQWQAEYYPQQNTHKRRNPYTHWNSEQIEDLRQRRERGQPWKQIAEEVGKSIHALRSRWYKVNALNKSKNRALRCQSNPPIKAEDVPLFNELVNFLHAETARNPRNK